MFENYPRVKPTEQTTFKTRYLLKTFLYDNLAELMNKDLSDPINARPLFLKLVGAFLLLPNCNDFLLSDEPSTEPPNPIKNSLFFAPKMAEDFCLISHETALGYFYLVHLIRRLKQFIHFIFFFYLKNWLKISLNTSRSEVFFLLEQEALYLDFIQDLYLKPLPQFNTAKVSKGYKKTTKNKAKLYSLNAMPFLLNLFRISMRRGRLLKNYTHFSSFIRLLYQHGGYLKLMTAISALNPFFYFRKRFRGRKTYTIPLVVSLEKREKIVSRLLLKYSKKRRTEWFFPDKLIKEINDGCKGRGQAFRYKKLALSHAQQQKFNIRFLRRRRFFIKKTRY